MKAVTQPARFCVYNPVDALHVLSSVAHFFNRAGLDSIQHAGEHRARRLPDDNKYSNGDQQADNWISERVAKPDTGRPDDDGKAGQTVSACMIAIGNKSCAVD